MRYEIRDLDEHYSVGYYFDPARRNESNWIEVKTFPNTHKGYEDARYFCRKLNAAE